MPLNRRVCWITFILLASWGWFAQSDELSNRYREALAKQLLTIDTFQASFSQVAIGQGGATEISQSGRVLFDRSGKFLWEVSEPFEQFILVTDDTRRVYDPDLEQLTISTFDIESQTSFANLILTSSTEILEKFEIEFEDNQYTLLPLEQGQDFVRLKINFEDEVLKTIEILDHFNTVNQFKFTDVKTNEPIGSDEFELEVSEDTEVIDQRTNTLDQPDNHDE